jgi:hypothetical protein
MDCLFHSLLPPTITGYTQASRTAVGKASPGRPVFVYADGVLAGGTIADAAGNWTHVLPTFVASGAHALTAAEFAPDRSGLSQPRAVTV